jgi:hypothetical protein
MASATATPVKKHERFKITWRQKVNLLLNKNSYVLHGG